MTTTPDPARLAQIRARSRRLAAIALDVSPGDNCVVTDLVESASDVQWLLERMEQPQDERDTRIAQLERELRDLRGTELNPSPMVLDAQAYGELRDEIAATMGDGWDLDEAEISILIKYVRWLAAGQPRDEDGYPIRRKAPEGLGGASGASRCRNSEATTQPQDDGDVRAVRDMLHGGYAARRALAARFADRIEALEARDAKAGEQR